MKAEARTIGGPKAQEIHTTLQPEFPLGRGVFIFEFHGLIFCPALAIMPNPKVVDCARDSKLRLGLAPDTVYVRAVERCGRRVAINGNDIVPLQFDDAHEKAGAVVKTLQSRLAFPERVFRLLPAPAHGQVGSHARKQFPRRKGLDQVIVRARSESLYPAFFARASGQKNNGNGSGCRFASQFFQQAESIQTRHHDVAQDEVGRIGQCGFERFFAVCDRHHAIAFA